MRNLRAALVLGWQMESNWTDPLLFFIYSVAQPARVAAAPRRHARRSSAAARTASPGVRRRSAARCGRCVVAGIAGPGLVRARRPRALPDAQVPVRQPERRSSSLLLGRGGARLGGGAMGTVDRARRSPSSSSACRSTSRPSTGRCSSRASCSAWSRSSRSACCSPRSASRRARRSGRIPEAVAGALFLVSGVVFPLAVLPAVAPGVGLAEPAHLVDRGRPARASCPDGPSSIGGAGSRVDSCHRYVGARTVRRSSLALCVTGALATLAAIAIFRSSERRAKDLGLLDRTTGS